MMILGLNSAYIFTVRRYSNRLFNASVWLATSIQQMRQLGLLGENELWSVASERSYTVWLKVFIECFRLDNAVSGYEWWLGFDWLGASNGIIAGHENKWRPKAGNVQTAVSFPCIFKN